MSTVPGELVRLCLKYRLDHKETDVPRLGLHVLPSGERSRLQGQSTGLPVRLDTGF